MSKEKIIFYVLVLLCLITHVIRTIYEIKKVRYSIKLNRLTFILMLVNMIVLWVSWFNMCENDIYKVNIPDIFRYAGLAIFVIGIIIFLISLLTIKALENYSGDLIKTGIYSIIRHPMYFSFILWMIGYSIYHEALFTFLFSFILIANVIYWKYLEERILERKYDDYKDYKRNTLF